MDLIELLPEFIRQAAYQVYEKDQDLLSLNGNEQSVVFRFAIYLNDLVKDHLPAGVVLDSEYNKVGLEAKRIVVQKASDIEAKEQGIRPDIILHQRKTSKANLLVIECKRGSSTDFNDFNKLQAMTSDHNNYQYKLGCFINFAELKPEFTYFVGGDVAKNLAKVIV